MRSVIVVAIFLTIGVTSATQAAEELRKPNILLIYSDDHGWADLGIQGVDQDIRTPNLDRLAKDGVRFVRGYSSAPQCVPSRAGVLTGRYQQRFGVEDNNKGPLPLSEVTIAERLKPAGYISGFVGKCHLDIGVNKDVPKSARVMLDHLPHHQGFDEYFRGELREYYASHALDGSPYGDAPRLVRENRFRVNVQTEAALSFLDRREAKGDQPWFLYLAWYAPHVPLESPEPWFSRTPESLPLKRRQALAMIAAMDDGLGRIREKLKEMKQDTNTLIVFIGDNGAPLGSAWDGSLNTPMVGQKGMLAEGGIRVPFLGAWPGRWPAGVQYDQPVINLDVAATAVAAAGLPVDEKLDGVNLTPFVTGEKKEPPHRELFWRWGSQAAVLEMPYKLIKLGSRPPLLFDITKPEGENIEGELSQRMPETVARLEKRLISWSSKLQPAGLSADNTAFSRHHEEMFVEHKVIRADGIKPSSPPNPTATDSGAIQGWIARNGTLAVRKGALTLTPDPKMADNARSFFTNSRLSLSGPVRVVLKIRAADAGKEMASITWRTKEASFEPHQSASFQWPAGEQWQEVQVDLPEQSRIIHVRINPPKNANGIEVHSIEFVGKANETLRYIFDNQPK